MNKKNELPEDSTFAAYICAFEFGGVECDHETADKASEEIVNIIAEFNKEKVEDFKYIICDFTKNDKKYLMTFAETPLGKGHILLRWCDIVTKQWYVPNIITAIASSGYNADNTEVVPIAQHPESTYSIEKAIKFLKKEKLLTPEDKGAFVTTTVDKKLIKVFPSKDMLHAYCDEVAPSEVLCSRHPSVKKANSFAKKLQKQTPSFEIELL